MMMINRRRVMGKKNTPYLPDYTLIFHWEASDGIVNDSWIDRIQGKALTAYGNPQLVDGMFKVRDYDVYFTNNSNLIFDAAIWQVDVEFVIDSLPEDKKSAVLVDFYSIRAADHAFALAITENGVTDFNPKLTGNNSISLYNVTVPFTTWGMLSKISIGMEKIDDTTYLPYYFLNGARYNSPNATTYQGAYFNTFGRANVVIGKGYISRASSTDWRYIKSLKIYKKEQL